MASIKNKHSRKFHQPKNRFLASHAKTPARNIILIVIVLTLITVFTTLVYSFIFNNKHIIKSKISNLATSYYENYFYPNIFSNNTDISDILSRYSDTGLTKVYLRQLILSDPNLSPQDTNYLQKYCDENTTYVQFYPESPYTKTSYHTDFTYSCSF